MLILFFFEFTSLISPKKIKVFFDYKRFMFDKNEQIIIAEFIYLEVQKYFLAYKEDFRPEMGEWIKQLSAGYLYQYLDSDFAREHRTWFYMIEDIKKIKEEDFIKLMYAKSRKDELPFLYLIGYDHYFQLKYVDKNGLINFSNKLIKIIALSIIFDPALDYKISSKEFNDFLNI
jgi:hypothetical protein